MIGSDNPILAELFEKRDPEYREFTSRLIPTVEKERVIGVRTPDMRAIAKKYAGTTAATLFMAELPHCYHEENCLHGFLIERMKDYGECIARLEVFLPCVDNWATCDLISPKVFVRNKPLLYGRIKEWIASGQTYTVRFGLEMLMSHFLGDGFTSEITELAAGVRSTEYYVNMMIAWFFATALAKQYCAALPYLTEHRLDIWVHNKTIQKAVESYRITDEQKAFLKTLRIK